MRLPHSHRDDDMRQMALCFCPPSPPPSWLHNSVGTHYDVAVLGCRAHGRPSEGMRPTPRRSESSRSAAETAVCWPLNFYVLALKLRALHTGRHCRQWTHSAGRDRIYMNLCANWKIWEPHMLLSSVDLCCGDQPTDTSHCCCCLYCVCNTSQDIRTLWGHSSEMILLLRSCLPELPTKHMTSEPNTEIPYKYADTVSVVSILRCVITVVLGQ